MINKLWNSFKNKFMYAIRGIWITIKEEKSLWNDIIFMFIVIGFGVWLNISKLEWSILILTIAIVIGFEIFNTAIEAMVDMISYQYNLKAKKIKDIAAGATLMVSIAAVIIGLIIFVPKLIDII